MLKRLFFSFILLLFAALTLVAQTPTTQGKEFWVSYMRNGYRNNTYNPTYDKLVLIATAKHACTVTVRNPNQNWQQHFEVQANNVNSIVIPDDLGYNDQKGGISNKGLIVTSTDTISLYIANEAENSYDAANVLPTQALGSRYLIQSNKSEGEQGTPQTGHYGESRASFLVIATEDDTQIQIIPSCLTFDGHSAGLPYPVTLNRGECYHVINQNAGSSSNPYDGDFSGTSVTSEGGKKIAVFSGNCITSIPGGLASGYDHIFEQAMPTDFWGKRFVVTSTMAPSYYNLLDDQVKITALNDNTTVWRDGTELCQLNEGNSYTFSMSLTNDPYTYLESDNPVAVYLYNHSHRSTGTNNYGDPSMVWISPVEQTVFEVNFSTFSGAKIQKHYVNIVCYTEHVPELTLDNTVISNSFSEVASDPQLSYARVEIEPGAHLLRCPGGLVAHVYGLGVQEGYAYTVGSSAKILTKQLYVDDILSTELPEGYSICQDESVSFRVETNYEITSVAWDFGDGSYGNGTEVSHEFNTAGNPIVEAVVYKEMNREVQPFDTLNVALYVHPKKVHHNDVITTCRSTYTYDGHDYPVPGTHEVHYETSFGCDSLVYLYFEQGDNISVHLDPIVTCEPVYHYDADHDFPVPGVYDLHFDVGQGCDSIVYVHLERGDNINVHLDPIVTCEPTYHYDADHDFPVPGDYEVHYELAMGCDSIVHVHLEEGVPYFRDEDVSACGDVFHYDEDHSFPVPGDYDVYFSTIHGCDSVIHLHIEQNSAIIYQFEHVACEEYTWYGVPYTESAQGIEHLVPNASPDGCDSLYIMDLTIVPNGDQYFEVDTCDVYHWMGQDYDVSDVYTITIYGDYGCESHLQLNLNLHQSPPFGRILGRDVMTIASNFWPGEYVYFLDDSTGMNTDNIHWELIDNPGWTIEPSGASCVITANARGTGVLHVWTTGESLCDEKEAFKTISCGGYAIDEDELVAVEIYPNPATEELFVKGEDVERVLVYNMVGQKIKEVEVHGDEVTRIPVGGLAPTLYLVEVRTGKGNKTQLVSVTQ